MGRKNPLRAPQKDTAGVHLGVKVPALMKQAVASHVASRFDDDLSSFVRRALLSQLEDEDPTAWADLRSRLTSANRPAA